MKTAEDIQRLVRRNNLVQLLIAAAAALLAAGLWPLSFWICRFLFYIPLASLGYDGMWETSYYVAWGMLMLLLIEGVRYARPLFNLIDYHRSWYHQSVWASSHSARALSGHVGTNPLGIAYLISQTLFSAPRMTVRAVESLACLLRPSREVVASAARVFNHLHANRRWHRRQDFGDDLPAVELLEQLELIWTEDKGEPEIRIPAGA